ncbi:MAG: nitroreductase family protein, partial [Ilumatobacteraceae bacterium]
MSDVQYLIDDAARQLLFTEARTANTFTSEPVSDEQVAAVYDLVRFGPTTMNTQPLRIVLARSDDARARV